jgi:putative pyruvate formate lyase activating enzyme
MISIDELKDKAKQGREMLRSCSVCPRNCSVDRWKDELGVCQIGKNPVVHSFGPHFGEESPLVGRFGSGTIFLSGCNLKCIFCQNYETSQLVRGKVVTSGELAEMMLSLQEEGCHNINLVSPTHVVPQILDALVIARESGLRLPLVYNCGGYESLETLRLLDGVVDIYMPDLKYMERETAWRLSQVENYPEVARKALVEMHRQVGILDLDTRGVAVRGLLIRHLVLPGGLAGTGEAMRFIANSLSKESYVNVMGQYRPMHRAHRVKEIDRYVTREEVDEAKRIATREGLHQGF